MANGENEVIFFEPKSVGEREWGEEILVAHAPNKYIGKILKIKAGKGGGLQYHRLKDEAEYIISGEMLVRYVENGELIEKVIGPGDCLRFPPGVVHQTQAITDVVAVEFSTPHLNDRVRVDAFYGLDQEGGLPTTYLGDIEVI